MGMKRIGWAVQGDLGASKRRRHVGDGTIATRNDSGALDEGGEQHEVELPGEGHERKWEWSSAEDGQGRLDGAQMFLFERVRAAGKNTGQAVFVLQ